jgi:hypothetical protein
LASLSSDLRPLARPTPEMYDDVGYELADANKQLRDTAVLLLETGMRPEDVYRIERGNVHLSEGYVFNPLGKTKAAKRRIT